MADRTTPGSGGASPGSACGAPRTRVSLGAPDLAHDYPACAVFRGGLCTCDAGDPQEVEVEGIGPMWRHWCKKSRRPLTLPLGWNCDRCGVEPPPGPDARDAALWREYLTKWGESLNRRATVEQWMFDAARGKRPMPTQQELREWATKLGVPEELRPAGVSIDLHAGAPDRERLRELAMEWQTRAGRLEARSDERMQAYVSQLQECAEDLLEALLPVSNWAAILEGAGLRCASDASINVDVSGELEYRSWFAPPHRVGP